MLDHKFVCQYTQVLQQRDEHNPNGAAREHRITRPGRQTPGPQMDALGAKRLWFFLHLERYFPRAAYHAEPDACARAQPLGRDATRGRQCTSTGCF